MKTHIQATATISLLLSTLGGCDRGTRPTAPPRSQADVAELKSKVVAQGQILPAGGVVRLLGAPGDIVDEVLVETGQEVKAGQQLIRLRSENVAEAQLAVLDARRNDAAETLKRTIAAADQQVEAAVLKIRHLASQRSQLEKNGSLLALAKEQVESSKRVMQQLETISKDALAGGYVGQIEIDRQKVAVGEAELAYKQQLTAHEKAVEDLSFARQAAEVELRVAEQARASAKASSALQIIDLEMATLKEKSNAAKIVAPTDGKILAVRTRRGEATTNYPLIEMANISQIVCEVEVNEMDAAIVNEGQKVRIYSRAFPEPLTGTVAKKHSLVGRPQLRPLDPLARVDFRSITTIVELDSAAAEQSQNWLQLQVEVEIITGSESKKSVASEG
ncbi:MAG: hypothetical protein Aurels2KO_19330 [Aureliella sp.]